MPATGTLIVDVETHSAELRWTLPPEEFVRLIGYTWASSGDVVLTTDLDEIRERILSARWIVGHNITMFDLPVIFGVRSDVPLQLAMDRRVFDTWVHAVLVHPAPSRYVNRHGKTVLANTPERLRKWFSLDEQAHQLGVTGKTANLKALAQEYGGFGHIPVDDERYRDYLRGDVKATERVARALLAKGPLDGYALREQELAARAAIISANGIRIDREAAQARVIELAARRETIMADLVARYSFPAEGKSPWSSAAGKAAIIRALADAEITEETRPDWPRTAIGNLSLSGDALTELTRGTAAEDLGQAMAELKGQRSLAQLALDSCYPDGFAHPEITMLQRSGRWSTTKPGLTVWTAHGAGAIEKSYFIPDTDDHVLLEIDYSNADARIVAALSGDTRYAERFAPGADGHLINAYAAWGRDVVDTDPKKYRQMAKPLGHGWSYGGRARTLSRQAGAPLEDAIRFVNGMDSTFHRIVAWQQRVRRFAERHGYVRNEWGRKLSIEPGREYTQAPALLGQNGTREIVCDTILAMPIHLLRTVKAQIHDALLFSVPKKHWQDYRNTLIDIMETTFHPAGGQEIHFPVEAGSPGTNWHEAAH